MNTIVLDRKKYVVVEQKEYNKLIEKAAAKNNFCKKNEFS